MKEKVKVYYLHVCYYVNVENNRKVASKTTYHYRYANEESCLRNYENYKISNMIAKVSMNYRYEKG